MSRRLSTTAGATDYSASAASCSSMAVLTWAIWRFSQHWMIHYLNANMRYDAARRAEEARFMEDFDDDFAVRHAGTFRAIVGRTGLDYLPIDCAETLDGRLLVFEVGTAMIVHSMDPPDLFPYKRPQMEKVFKAFQAILYRAADAAP